MGSWLPGFPPFMPDPGRSGPHSPSNAETPTAQGRRRCCGARRQRRPEGRAGLRGRRPAALARSPSPGGVPHGQLGSAPAPSREREQNALTAPGSSLGSTLPRDPALQVDTEGQGKRAGQCPGTARPSREQSTPTWARAACRSEGGLLAAPTPQHPSQMNWGLSREGEHPFLSPKVFQGPDTPPATSASESQPPSPAYSGCHPPAPLKMNPTSHHPLTWFFPQARHPLLCP